jgi:hypothetical protein
MFKSSLNPYEEIVAKATDEKQTVEAWDVLLTIWDKVNDDGEDGARNCVIALQKRLQHRSANVQLFSLTLADALVNNCNYISRHRLSVYTNLLVIDKQAKLLCTKRSIRGHLLRPWSD